MNRPLEPVLDQAGKGPRVIDMRMTQDDGVDVLDRHGNCRVVFLFFCTRSREHAALEQYGRWRVDARDEGSCAVLLHQDRRGQPVTMPEGWTVVARVNRPTDREETTLVLRRRP